MLDLSIKNALFSPFAVSFCGLLRSLDKYT